MKSVRCLLGRPHRLLPQIISEIGQGHDMNHSCVLLVPEQFTLQAELELTERLQLKGFFSIQVFSPTRLAQRVFEYAGSPQRIRIDSRGKSMLLRLILEEQAEALTFYRNAARSAGFIEKLSTLISDIKASDISPDQLSLSAESLPAGALRQKMLDTALLYTQYEQRLAGQFADGEDVEKALVERLPASAVLQNAHLWVYGFDMITHSFARQLLAFSQLTDAMTVALSMDTPPAADASLFTPAAESLIRFEQLLDAQHIAHHREKVETLLQAPAAIQHLERHLFAFPTVVFDDTPSGLHLHAAASPHAQVHHVAAEVLTLLRDGDYALSQLTIQYPPGGEYPRLLRQILPQYGITAHVQEKRVALHHPMVQMLLSALRCLTHHFRQEDVLSFLKSGFATLQDDDCFVLENHALAYGLRGSAWLRPLQKGNAEELTVLEPLREMLMLPLLTLRESLRAARTTEATLRTIFEFLLALHVPEKLQAEQDTLRALALPAEINYSTQVWNALMQLLSQLHTLLPSRRVRLLLVLEMLQAGLAATELQVLPPETDMLICGEVGNVRAERIRALFLLGMNDQNVSAASAALLDDGERQLVQQSLGAHMGIQQSHRLLLRRVDLLTVLSLPSEQLYIGWSQSDSMGKALRPDITIHTLRRLFPEAQVSGGALDDGMADMLCAPVPALSALSIKLRDALSGQPIEPVWRAALGCLSDMPEARNGLRLLRGALHARFQAEPLPQPLIAQATSHAIFSVSRLETFAACPFRHYVRYLLSPHPRKIYGVYRQDLGTFYHDALKAYAQQARQTASWPLVSRDENDGLLLASAAPLLEAWATGPLGEDARTKAQGREVLRIAQASAWAITRQVQASDFRPEWLELPFGLEPDGNPALSLVLPEGGAGKLHGRIDRVDTWRGSDEQTYATIMDYKSGSTPPKLSSALIRWGLQLQLPLYLSALLSMYPDAQIAGAYYAPLCDPLVDSMSEEPAEIAKAWEKALVPQGFSTKLPDEVQAKPSGGGPSIAPSEVSTLLTHAKRQAGAHISAIQQGVIHASPMGEEKHLPCSYCDYKAICGLDAALDDAQARLIPPEKKLEEALREGFSDTPYALSPIRL